MADTSTMSSKGQVVIPKRVREALQATSGARIGFELKGDRAVMFVLRKKTAKPADGYGLVRGRGRTVAALEDWDAKLGAELRREYARR
jgi:AbrB family looped-hinge helix DNA binding protein